MKHIVAELLLLSTDEGGRKTPLLAGMRHRCIIEVGDGFFGCQVFLGSDPVRPGQRVTVPIAFLSPDQVIPKLPINAEFRLHEGQPIALGRVLEVRD